MKKQQTQNKEEKKVNKAAAKQLANRSAPVAEALNQGGGAAQGRRLPGFSSTTSSWKDECTNWHGPRGECGRGMSCTLKHSGFEMHAADGSLVQRCVTCGSKNHMNKDCTRAGGQADPEKNRHWDEYRARRAAEAPAKGKGKGKGKAEAKERAKTEKQEQQPMQQELHPPPPTPPLHQPLHLSPRRRREHQWFAQRVGAHRSQEARSSTVGPTVRSNTSRTCRMISSTSLSPSPMESLYLAQLRVARKAHRWSTSSARVTQRSCHWEGL